MKFEKLFDSKDHKLFKITGEEVTVTPEMAYSVKWSDIEGREEEYNEEFLSKLRQSLKNLEEQNKYVFIEGIYDKDATPGQYNNTMKHTSRRIKDCANVIGFALPPQIAQDKDVADDFIQKLSEKHPQYVYFAKTPCNEQVILY